MKKLLVIVSIFIIFIILFGCENAAPDRPIVEGIKEGEIYTEPIEITLKQREKDVEYIATIDEEEYSFGTPYAKEGKHMLKILASKGSKTSEVVVPFEIDSTPPGIPTVTGVKDNEIYYESVHINVEKEDGITYEFMIDESEYMLDTPFEEVGKHVFRVIATKERNNLTSEKNIAFVIDNSTYTQEEVNYFTEIALGSEYGGSPIVKKWLKDVKIKVGGNPTEDDLDILNSVVNELDKLIPTITIELVDKNENMNMYFVPQGDFRKYIPNAVLGNWAYFRYYADKQGEIESATITIGTFGSDQTNRNHHIIEELTQALGMGNDSAKYEESIFYETEGQSFSQEYSELDKKVIEILYRRDIRIGMSKDDVLQTLSERTEGR